MTDNTYKVAVADYGLTATFKDISGAEYFALMQEPNSVLMNKVMKDLLVQVDMDGQNKPHSPDAFLEGRSAKEMLALFNAWLGSMSPLPVNSSTS